MRLLSARDCANMFSVTTKTWYEWVRNDPTAPRQAIETPRFSRWRDCDVAAYQETLIAEQRTGYMKKGAKTGEAA